MTEFTVPRGLRLFNRVVKGVQRLGLTTGPVVVLTVPGRRSGQPRSTPVTPFEHGGARYVLGGIPGADWVRNVRAAGGGTLRQGRRLRAVRLVEVPVAERGPILRSFAEQVPRGVEMMLRAGVVRTGSVAELRAAAAQLPPFRIDPA